MLNPGKARVKLNAEVSMAPSQASGDSRSALGLLAPLTTQPGLLRRWPLSHPSQSQSGYRADGVRPRPFSGSGEGGAGKRRVRARGRPTGWVSGCLGPTTRDDQAARYRPLQTPGPPRLGAHGQQQAPLANPLCQPLPPSPKSNTSASL